MKPTQLQISIPEPCHENWNEMSPTEKGRFCKVCTKEVIDFTSKSDEEIIHHIKKHNNACGRFYPSQLNRKLIADRKKRNHWLSYVASLLLPMTLFSQEKTADKKNPTKVEQLDSLQFKRLDINSALQRKAKTQKELGKRIAISGTIVDEEGIPLPGVHVSVKNKNSKTTTDFDGNFSMNVRAGSVLTFNSFGFKTKELTINASQEIYNIQLAVDPSAEAVPIATHELSEIAGEMVTIDADSITIAEEQLLKVNSKKELGKQITISGNVTDEDEFPLPSATIAIKGTDKGKATDFDGDFSITANVGDTLIISYVGYETQEISVVEGTFEYKIKMKLGEALEASTVVGGIYYCDGSSYGLPNQETPEKKARKKRIKNYFTFKRKKWLEKRAKRKAARAARRAKRKSKR
ncbi:carboxypeptidase-like protein [Kordia periserrulae]|uniref:Carboxypeptidase-like protein n=1 Tax=Kordia periserrulae TaxID=701523 RepID=A0A2T6C044_9FLAO|nr:carboxypeptidase-like regulatory domain-containing protein [Kordia periserrulae]PTX61617.1 carboxypeptidase-like protein [Kordia periserrulae]